MDGRIREREEVDVKTIRMDEACRRYGLGRNTMRKVAEDSGAVVKVGKCLLINVTVLDAYMDALAGR